MRTFKGDELDARLGRRKDADAEGLSKAAARIPELDGLRGMAIGMVILWHYFTTTMQPRPGAVSAYLVAATKLTWSGVDLFFVLSGFLIGGILLDARGATNFFQVFYRRRLFRIVPIYAAVLVVFPALAFIRHSAHPSVVGAVASTSPPVYMYWTFTQNLWMALNSSLGTNSLGMTWSLAVEEQFYLTLPLLVSLLSPRLFRGIVITGILLAPLLRISIHFLWPPNWGAAYVLMPCRADSLLLGVFAAILLRSPDSKERIQNSKLFSVAFPALLLGALFFLLRAPGYADALMSTLGYSWLALLYVTSLVFTVSHPESALSKFLRLKWLCWLGSIAYGTYLLHQGIQRLVFRLFSIVPPAVDGVKSFFITVAAFILTLVAARISWLYFEKPLVRIGHLTNYKHALKPSGTELNS